MFESFDVDRNGKIDADELGRALAHYEYVQSLDFSRSAFKWPFSLRVGPTILDLLVKKYGESSPLISRILGGHVSPKAVAPPPRNRGPHYGAPPPPQINMDRFVCACVVVRQMCQLYDQCSGNGAAQISRDDFIKAVITLP
jgi:hypothetical protein